MSEKHREVYLDHAATTYLDPRVKKAMDPYFEDYFGNPSSLYRLGRKSKEALSEARTTAAQALHCQTDEIIFTSGGTEGDNLAILGVCKAWEEAQLDKLSSSGKERVLAGKRHIVTSAIEHRAVLETCQYLEKQGYEATYLPVSKDGIVDPETVRLALREDTLLVSIMYANNEIGTIQPVQKIAAICKENNVYFHTDACQAAGALSIDVARLGVDLMTVNASKIYGPKGVGLLYVRQGTKIKPLFYGGGQEKELRSGTENIPGIVGFAKALELATYEKNDENERLSKLRDYFIDEVTSRIVDVALNGHPTKRLPGNVNLSIDAIDGEDFILLADAVGIACATGSACDSATLAPSHVLIALGASPASARSSVRFTLGKRTSKADIDYTISQIVTIVEQLRKRTE